MQETNDRLPVSDRDEATNVARKESPTPSNSSNSAESASPKLTPTRSANLNVSPPSSPNSAGTVVQPEAELKLQKVSPDSYIFIGLGVLTVLLVLIVAIRWYITSRPSLKRPSLYYPKPLRPILAAREAVVKRLFDEQRFEQVHGVGIGIRDDGRTAFLQYFVEDASPDKIIDLPFDLTGTVYEGLEAQVVQLPRASALDCPPETGDDPKAHRHELIGGISGANAVLSTECGTIGYFCKDTVPKMIASVSFKAKHYLLSNAHVFADILTPAVGTPPKLLQQSQGTITQPSLGENLGRYEAGYHPTWTRIDLNNDFKNPNLLDAALVPRVPSRPYQLRIPVIGRIKGILPIGKIKQDMPCQKFGRSTCHTVGKVLSINAAIWVEFKSLGTKAFFANQILVVPTSERFVERGDSGSLLVDMNGNAMGLIFAGDDGSRIVMEQPDPPVPIKTPMYYALANPIEMVTKAFGVDLEL